MEPLSGLKELLDIYHINLISFDLCFLQLNKDNSSAVKFKDAI